jgi:hypothetical protein
MLLASSSVWSGVQYRFVQIPAAQFRQILEDFSEKWGNCAAGITYFLMLANTRSTITPASPK